MESEIVAEYASPTTLTLRRSSGLIMPVVATALKTAEVSLVLLV